MDLNVTKTRFHHLSKFMTRRGIDYAAATGHIFPRPIPTRQAFLNTWRDMAKLLDLCPPPPPWPWTTPPLVAAVGSCTHVPTTFNRVHH